MRAQRFFDVLNAILTKTSGADIVTSTAGAMDIERAADDMVAAKFDGERAALRVLIAVVPDIPTVASELSTDACDTYCINHLIHCHASLNAVKSVLGQHLLPARDLVVFV